MKLKSKSIKIESKKIRLSLKSKFSELKVFLNFKINSLKLLFEKPLMQYLLNFLFVIIFYGVMINLVLNEFKSQPFFTWRIFIRIPAWGFIAYAVKVELPNIISSCFPKKIQTTNPNYPIQ